MFFHVAALLFYGLLVVVGDKPLQFGIVQIRCFGAPVPVAFIGGVREQAVFDEGVATALFYFRNGAGVRVGVVGLQLPRPPVERHAQHEFIGRYARLLV